MCKAVTNTGYDGMPTSLVIVQMLICSLGWGSAADKLHTSQCLCISVADVTDCASSPANGYQELPGLLTRSFHNSYETLAGVHRHPGVWELIWGGEVPGWLEGGLQALPGGGAGQAARPQPGAATQVLHLRDTREGGLQNYQVSWPMWTCFTVPGMRFNEWTQKVL